MKTATKLSRALDGLAEQTGKAVSWLALLLTLVTVYDATMRYGFRSGSVAIQEAEWHIFALIFLLSAAYTFKHDAHVRVDIFYARMSTRGKAFIDTAGALLFLLPFSFLVIYTSIGFVENSWAVSEGSGDPGGLPARYILKAMIPLGFGLLFVQGLNDLIKNLLRLTSPEEAPPAERDEVTDGV